MQISIELDSVLKSRKVTLYEFCKITDLSYQQGLDITKNRTKGISFSVVEKICLYLNCSVSDLLVLTPESRGYLRWIMSEFPETDSVKRFPQTKPHSMPKPFLQWVGGKREMLPQYNAYIPKGFRKYLEPFLGGGALFFYLNPRISYLNDNNRELIKAYEAVRDYPEEIIDLLHQMRRKHSKDLYITVRRIDRQFDILNKLKSYEVAARLIYLNQTCFNAVYRVNKSGQFNVPIGSSLNRVICDPEAIRNASKALQYADINSEDFEEILDKTKKGDFIYFDPPYFPVSKYSDFNRYTKEKFYRQDQIRLKNIFKKLNHKGCKVMLSNSDSEFIKELYSGFNIHIVYSGRNLNSRAEKRSKISELLITNY